MKSSEHSLRHTDLTRRIDPRHPISEWSKKIIIRFVVYFVLSFAVFGDTCHRPFLWNWKTNATFAFCCRRASIASKAVPRTVMHWWSQRVSWELPEGFLGGSWRVSWRALRRVAWRAFCKASWRTSFWRFFHGLPEKLLEVFPKESLFRGLALGSCIIS